MGQPEPEDEGVCVSVCVPVGDLHTHGLRSH